MSKRILLLWSCLFVWTVALLAQSAPGGAVKAFKHGSSRELTAYLGDKVELILENRTINVDHQVAVENMAAFFSNNKVRNFTMNHHGKRDESGFFVGTLNTSNGNFRVNCFFKKIKHNYVIHQIRIDKTDE